MRFGTLELEGLAFELSSIQESNVLQTLKSCLQVYAPASAWQIRFSPITLPPVSAVGVKATGNPQGSLAANEAAAAKAEKQRDQ